MKEAKFRELEQTILQMIEDNPRSTRAVAKALGMTMDDAYIVIRRLKNHELLYVLNGKWRRCSPPAMKDTSIFPRPGYKVPSVGFFG